MRYFELLETSTAGGTCSANIATVVGSNSKDNLGFGFDSTKDWGIYDFAKKKKKDSEIIKRIKD